MYLQALKLPDQADSTIYYIQLCSLKNYRKGLIFKQKLYFLQPVKEILIENDAVKGVLLEDGKEISAKAVISNATPKVTFLDLIQEVWSYHYW